MFGQFFASRSAAVISKENTMNLHSKLATSVALYVAAIALIVPLATLSTNTPTTSAASTTANTAAANTTPDIIAASQTCADQGYLGCSDDVRDYWAKDAYNAYAAPISATVSRADILKGFVSTYEGSYSTPVNWGPTYINVQSLTSPDVYHVFHVIQPRNA